MQGITHVNIFKKIDTRSPTKQESTSMLRKLYTHPERTRVLSTAQDAGQATNAGGQHTALREGERATGACGPGARRGRGHGDCVAVGGGVAEGGCGGVVGGGGDRE